MDIEARYQAVATLIDKTATRMAAVCRLDREECVSSAHLSFMKAVNSFDTSRGDFEPRLVFRIQKDLLAMLRKEMRGLGRLQRVAVRMRDIPQRKREWNLDEFLENLPPDARLVVRVMLGGRYRPNGCEEAIARAVRAGEIVKAGWSHDRVRAAFDRVRQELFGG